MFVCARVCASARRAYTPAAEKFVSATRSRVSWHCGSFRASRVMYTFAVCNCGATIRTLYRDYPYPYRDYPYPYRDYPYPYRDYPYPYRDYPYPYRDYPYPYREYPYPYRDYPYPYRDHPYPYCGYPYLYRARLSVPLFRLGYGRSACSQLRNGRSFALRLRRRRRQRTAHMCTCACRTYP
jgi:hypothetical protein